MEAEKSPRPSVREAGIGCAPVHPAGDHPALGVVETFPAPWQCTTTPSSTEIAAALRAALALGIADAFLAAPISARQHRRGFKEVTSDTNGLRGLWRRYPGPLVGVATGATTRPGAGHGPSSMSGPSDKSAETLKKILAVLDERLPRATTLISPDPSGKKRSGRPPSDLELMVYAAFVEVAAERGYTTDEALNSKIREAAKKRGLHPISRETLKKKLKALRERMPRLDFPR